MGVTPDRPEDGLQDNVEEIRRILLQPETLASKISPVIAQALSDKIRDSRDEIAVALAPVIGEVIRRQSYDARDDIIDALYPIIGQTINRAITEAIRDIARKVDHSLRRNLSPGELFQRFRARISGVNANEIALLNAIPFEVYEIFLIQRESGLLILHLSNSSTPIPDRDLVSGMLTAIRSFAHDAFGQEQKGELDAIEYGEQTIILEAAGSAYLALVVTGIAPSDIRDQMCEILIDLHENYYDSLLHYDGSDEALKQEAKNKLRIFIDNSEIEEEKSGPLSTMQKALLIGLLIVVVLTPIAGCGYWIWRVENQLYTLAHPAPTSIPTATNSPTPTATTTRTPSPTTTTTPTSTMMPTATPTALPSQTPQPTATRLPYNGVMLGNVYLRAEPDGPTSVSVASVGNKVKITAQYGEWYRIELESPDNSTIPLVGWVRTQWVTILQEVPPNLITPAP